MGENLTAPPVLSTPDTHILNETVPAEALRHVEKLSDEQLDTRYEIARTVQEIRQHKWKRVALQFPDQMLPDSARVYQLLARGLKPDVSASQGDERGDMRNADLPAMTNNERDRVKLTILADTSYGSCCVDEIAAEHVDAEAVVHYGRACLSLTARLPVLHVFTTKDLDRDAVIRSFQSTFPELDTNVIVTADVPYAAHVDPVCNALVDLGYTKVFAASVVHNPSSALPNRTVPASVTENPATLNEWHIFHISEPPTSLLLTLTSRVASIQVCPISGGDVATTSRALAASTKLLLRRRYALVTSLSTVPVWGILINTLSVKNYLHMVDHVKSQIAKAGKKSYLFVVGKLNASKVANFSEIGGWVVIGCWESSLIDSKDFYKPIITPFELDLALKTDDSRVWTGDWRGDFQGVLEAASASGQGSERAATADDMAEGSDRGDMANETDSEEESEPPEFDLRTGRYISRTRPMQDRRALRDSSAHSDPSKPSSALAKRANGEMVSVNGMASPAAEFLAQKRTWRGLGSDFKIRYEDEEVGSAIEEGRTGVARGYTVGESPRT